MSRHADAWSAEAVTVSFAKLASAGHLECAAVVKPLRHIATSPEQL